MQNENTLVVVFCVSVLLGIGMIFWMSGVVADDVTIWPVTDSQEEELKPDSTLTEREAALDNGAE